RRLTAFVLKRGAVPARIDLGPAEAVEDAAGAWRRAVGRGGDALAEGAALRKLLLAPLARHVAGAKELLVCPDGAVAVVPLGALPGPAAREAAVARAVEAAGYCHRASHGYFAAEEVATKGLSPLVASGLVLAAGEKEDASEGSLTALEVAELDLSGCRLAVLS